MKLSKHSKIRLRERTNFNHKERQLIFKNALKNGLSPEKVKNQKLKNFMNSKNRRCKIKLYKGYLFLYGRNSHILYTMYKVPEHLGGDSNEN